MLTSWLSAANRAEAREDAREIVREALALRALQRGGRDADRFIAAGQPVGGTGCHNPPAREQRCDNGRFSVDLDPHVEARCAASTDPAGVQGAQKLLAPARILATRAAHERLHLAIAPQLHHQTLQYVAYPSRSTLEAPLHARDREGVARQDGQA